MACFMHIHLLLGSETSLNIYRILVECNQCQPVLLLIAFFVFNPGPRRLMQRIFMCSLHTKTYRPYYETKTTTTTLKRELGLSICSFIRVQGLFTLSLKKLKRFSKKFASTSSSCCLFLSGEARGVE